MKNTLIAANLARVQQMLTDACVRAGRDPTSITLVAVSKTNPASAVLEALEAGAQHFGENRVEEAEVKIPAVNAAAASTPIWHMIGHVQSRKAKDVVPLFQMVHSVDSVKLAQKFSALAVERGRRLDVLLEVNVSGEETKQGFEASDWERLPAVRQRFVDEVLPLFSLPGLYIRGLMTMAPIVAQMEQARPVFASLAGLRAALAAECGQTLPDLSMGMTDDYPVAIEEGATIVRVGRAIFGERQK
jgi:pyridoxal phosphate enzyme (YggS family)